MRTACRVRSDGVTLLEFVVVLAILVILIGLLLTGVQFARQAAYRVRCTNNVRQLSLALHLYHDTDTHFPPGMVGRRQAVHRYMSWGTHLLPHLEQSARWDEAVRAYAANPGFSWPRPHPGLSMMNPAFTCPLDGRTEVAQPYLKLHVGLSSYLGVSGADQFTPTGILYADSRTRLADVIDGASSTLIIGERPPSPNFQYGWWYAGIGQSRTGSADGVLGVSEINQNYNFPTFLGCPRGPYAYRPGNPNSLCSTFHFWSLHPGGANFAFADGSVRFLRYEVAPLMPALATRAGGEVTSPPD
jgi:prepilin-type processing-associated H-X9-DG protein